MRCPAQLVHTACLHAGVAAHCSLQVVALTAAPYVTVPAVMRCPAGVGCTSPYRRDACLVHVLHVKDVKPELTMDDTTTRSVG